MKKLLTVLLALFLVSVSNAQTRSTDPPGFVADSGFRFVPFKDSIKITLNLDSNASPYVYVEFMLTEVIDGIKQQNAVLDTYFLPDYQKHIVHSVPGIPGTNYYLDMTFNSPGHATGQYNSYVSTLSANTGIVPVSDSHTRIWYVNKQIKIENTEPEMILDVYNIIGQNVLHQDQAAEKITLDQNPGIYIVTLSHEGRTVLTRKIQIE